MFKQEAMKPGKVLIMAFWFLNYSSAFSGLLGPAQTLISEVKLHAIKSPRFDDRRNHSAENCVLL
jgi:hypothetical protein